VDTRSDVDYLTIEQAAVKYHVSGQTIRRWVKNGKLTAVQPGGSGGRLLIVTTNGKT
jgi:excisionase family DNA binding protein